MPPSALSPQPVDKGSTITSVHSWLQTLVEEYALRQRKGLYTMANPVTDNIRRSLGRTAQMPIEPRPTIYKPRPAEATEIEAGRFLDEIRKLSAVGKQLSRTDVESSLKSLFEEQNVRKATTWETP